MSVKYCSIESDIDTLYKKLLCDPHIKFLGLDLGKKKIGLAICYFGRDMILPHSVVCRVNTEIDLQNIYRVLNDNAINEVVVGVPLQNGVLHKSAQYVIDFVTAMINNTHKMNVYLQDESFSTNEAINMLQDLDLSRKKREAIDDAVAAMIILQDFTQKLRRNISANK